jgi:signal transduction histidine kinase
MTQSRWFSFRWMLFFVALTGVAGLTVMNIVSLSNLREQSVAELKQARQTQLMEFGNKVRSRLFDPFRPIRAMNTDSLQSSLAMGEFPPRLQRELARIAEYDSLFLDLYFTTPECTPCESGNRIQRFSRETQQFEWVKDYPEMVCDGIGLARTQMKAQVQEYKWNFRSFFDNHRSMTIVFVDQRMQSITGYLCLVINRDYLINNVIEPELMAAFGERSDDGITVWVSDWARKEIIAASDDAFPFDPANAQLTERFPGMFETWNLKASYDQSLAMSLSDSSYRRNMIALIFAALLLTGSFLVIFIIAQRERELSLRQAGFLANVTHELKTPIAVMQAAGENLADGRVTDEKRLKSYGRHIYDEAVRLRGMIDKLLDVAKSDAGQLTAKLQFVKAHDFVTDFVELHRPYWESRGFEVKLNVQASNGFIAVDRDHLDTVLSNLADNAVKYSNEHKVLAFSCWSVKDDLFISVTDEGCGIPAHAQRHVFEKFYRVEDPLTAHTKGHGLGLSIVKNLVQLNKGKISLRSIPGKGSTFTLYFPLQIVPETSQEKAGVLINAEAAS